jgi:hypothetical protein
MLTADPALVPTFLLSSIEIEALTPKSDERRTSSRIAEQATLRIAPIFADEPSHSSSQLVVGKDISAGGISFYLGSTPHFAELEIELGPDSAPIYLRAQVVQSRPVVGLEPYYLVSCRFTGRALRR